MLGGVPCGGDNLLQPYSLEKAFYLEKALPVFYAQKILMYWRRYRAPMICSQAHFTNPGCCLSLSIPAMILPPQSNKSNSSGPGTRVAALRSWPITICWTSWFQHFG